MNELFGIADEVSVFRDGALHRAPQPAEERDPRRHHSDDGRPRDHARCSRRRRLPIGDVVLSVKGLTLKGVFRDISFDLASR